MLEYSIADAFTATPLEGNPVAVFRDGSGLTAEKMQRIAREMNLSETTFVLPAINGGDARIRIFTPVNELPFAGHPMLGTAFVLGQQARADRLVVETAMGPVPLRFQWDGDRITTAWMHQPVPSWEPYQRAGFLLEALGLSEAALPVEAYRNGPRHVLVALPDLDTLWAVRPDLRALAELPDMAAICFAGSGSRWTMRMFSPAYGVSEDAATGSAAGPVAIHLARHGVVGWDTPLVLRQGERLGRPSTMHVRVRGGAGRIEQVEVGGSAVVVGHGVLEL